jgi:hypothetical protein
MLSLGKLSKLHVNSLAKMGGKMGGDRLLPRARAASKSSAGSWHRRSSASQRWHSASPGHVSNNPTTSYSLKGGGLFGEGHYQGSLGSVSHRVREQEVE